MASPTLSIHRQDWLFLVLLSVLWGGSFFFAEVALRELPPLTIVLVRVVLGALLLVPMLYILGGRLPRSPGRWLPYAVMGLLNNAIPFSLIVTGQTYISSGMASVLNATTPLFTVLVLAAFSEERLIARRVIGVLIGLGGVIVLRQPTATNAAHQAIGMLLCLGAALSYGFSGLWGRRYLIGVPPITAATGQLICSSLIMAVVACVTERPWQLPLPSAATWLSLIGLAALSTAFAYLLFFQILKRSGAANVMLVTLLIPVTAILLGSLVLGEALTAREITGALVIGSALLVIDGRPLAWAWRQAVPGGVSR